MKAFGFFVGFLLMGKCAFAQQLAPLTESNSPLLTQIFSRSSQAFFDVLSQPEKYRYQVIYTKINRDKNGQPTLEHHYYNYSRQQYFYPASLVKLPLSVLALHKTDSMAVNGISAYTPMLTGVADPCQTAALFDFTQKNGYPSVDGYVKKMMLVSDNDAYNRIYEYLGYDYINEKLHKYQLPDVRIVQRFAQQCDSLSYYCTNPICFLNGADTIFKQSACTAQTRLVYPYGEAFMGNGFYDFTNYFHPYPRSFIYNNFLCLQDLQTVLEGIYFPETFDSKNRIELSTNSRKLLQKYMGQYPRESSFPSYNLNDNYKKYFMIGDGTLPPSDANLRIFNVVGKAYGVLSDCAYVADFENNVEFMLTAVLYVNEDEILNDDKYEYDTIGHPFLAELGNLIYNFERTRNRNFTIDFTDKKMLFD
ncbi:MAG: serine hydrolase [Bacteroidia bacterium]|nr:serine hydrolase [Bacteroidia bacterium]